MHLQFYQKIADTWLVLRLVLVDFGLHDLHCMVANFLCGHCQNLLNWQHFQNIQMYNGTLERCIVLDVFGTVESHQNNWCFGALCYLKCTIFKWQ